MGKIAIAIVALPEMIAPDRIGIRIAANRGLMSEVFTNESDTRKWLRSEVAAKK